MNGLKPVSALFFMGLSKVVDDQHCACSFVNYGLARSGSAACRGIKAPSAVHPNRRRR